LTPAPRRATHDGRATASCSPSAVRAHVEIDHTNEGGTEMPKTPPPGGRRPGHPSKRPDTKANRGISDDIELMTRVIQLSWRDDAGKQESIGADRIAKILRQEGWDVSKRTVLALQREAIRRGLVRVVTCLPAEVARITYLEQELKRVLGLRHVLLVSGEPAMLQDRFSPRHANIHRDVTAAMAERVVEFLCHKLQMARRVAPKRQYRVGVAWGSTLYAVARALQSTDHTRDKRPDDTVFLPVIGTTSNDNLEPLEANSVATIFARVFGARFAHFPSPAFVPHALADSLRAIPQIADMLARAAACDLVITSMGPLHGVQEADELRLSSDPVQNEQLFTEARAGACGEICFALFDEEGREVRAATHGAMGLDLPTLQRIAASETQRLVLVVGGDRRRIDPLWVALTKARLASVLVSDTVTASELLERAKQEGLWTPME